MSIRPWGILLAVAAIATTTVATAAAAPFDAPAVVPNKLGENPLLASLHKQALAMDQKAAVLARAKQYTQAQLLYGQAAVLHHREAQTARRQAQVLTAAGDAVSAAVKHAEALAADKRFLHSMASEVALIRKETAAPLPEIVPSPNRTPSVRAPHRPMPPLVAKVPKVPVKSPRKVPVASAPSTKPKIPRKVPVTAASALRTKIPVAAVPSAEAKPPTASLQTARIVPPVAQRSPVIKAPAARRPQIRVATSVIGPKSDSVDNTRHLLASLRRAAVGNINDIQQFTVTAQRAAFPRARPARAFSLKIKLPLPMVPRWALASPLPTVDPASAAPIQPQAAPSASAPHKATLALSVPSALPLGPFPLPVLGKNALLIEVPWSCVQEVLVDQSFEDGAPVLRTVSGSWTFRANGTWQRELRMENGVVFPAHGTYMVSGNTLTLLTQPDAGKNAIMVFRMALSQKLKALALLTGTPDNYSRYLLYAQGTEAEPRDQEALDDLGPKP